MVARIAFALCAVVLVVAACTPATTPVPPPPTLTAPPTVVVQEPTRIVVTLTPSPLPTLPPTATLPFDPLTYAGAWNVRVEVTLLSHTRFNSVVFKGVGSMRVGADTALTGRISFDASSDQQGCTAIVLDSRPLDAAMRGRMTVGADGRVYAEVELTPDDPAQTTPIRMYCDTPVRETVRTDHYLWPALRATRDLRLRFPVERRVRDRSLADLSGPGGGLLYGTVQIDTQVSR
jgi:hypothetical protein